jgi:cytochrome d ubiquinol oxidase subunit II
MLLFFAKFQDFYKYSVIFFHRNLKMDNFVLGFMGIVSLWVPFLNEHLYERWFGGYNMYLLAPIPVLTALLFIALWRTLAKPHAGKADWKPFLISHALFLMGYIGLAISLWPTIVPYDVTLEQAAAAPESLSLMLVGVVIMLPVILAYTGWCYYIFRGKTDDKHGY